MNSAPEIRDKSPVKASEHFHDFCEALLRTSRREFFAYVVVALVVGLGTFGVMLFANWGTPVPAIVKSFATEYPDLVGWVVGFFFLAIGLYHSFLQRRARSRERAAEQAGREAAFAAIQKERIRILDRFEPPPTTAVYHDDRSIYTAFIRTLSRLKTHKAQIEASGALHDVCILLCSPAFDYLRPEYAARAVFEENWGKEFIGLLTDVMSSEHLKFDICYLPLGSQTGINAMHDFLSGLANYLSEPSSGSSVEFVARLEALEKRTKWCDGHIQSWASKGERRFNLRDHMVNVPFQIILINGQHFQEVVVSFAGREVLEREQKYGVKGFFSSDPHVVETFNEIYQTYVESPERIPYVPLHTLGIVREHDEAGDHVVASFGNGLVKNLHVSAGTFSPVIGNSSKFTAWLLETLLTTGNPKVPTSWRNSIRRILDVGAGTGVLALAAGAAIRKHGKRKDFKVVALDACPHAYKLLVANCAKDTNIDVRQIKLQFDHIADTRKVRSSWFEDDRGEKVSIVGELCQFDLVIGDLPFIHAEKQKDSDARFVDLNHQLHQALMWLCWKTQLLAENGLLVTAFSSLGGPEDITDFERSIRENSLQVIQRVDFYESGYMWMVYVLMKQTDYNKYGDRLWWELLEAKRN